MIPFRDDVPSKSFPIVTVTLIGINIGVFIQELALGPQLQDFLFLYGVVPAKWSYWGKVPDLSFGDLTLPYFTSLFLHGGWFHLIGNMWYLWLFGDNIEDRLGHVRFLLFYLACGLLAGIVHTTYSFDAHLPAVGASGAIAGVLGAYLINYPHARIVTLVPFFFYYEIIELPAIMVLGAWFLVQFLNGTAAIATTAQGTGGVAWWAHIGGFIAGIFMYYVLSRDTRKRVSL